MKCTKIFKEWAEKAVNITIEDYIRISFDDNTQTLTIEKTDPITNFYYESVKGYTVKTVDYKSKLIKKD